MKIKWNEVTWYSWLLTAVIFLGVIPYLTFYFVSQYQEIADLDSPILSNQVQQKPLLHTQVPIQTSQKIIDETSSDAYFMRLVYGNYDFSGQLAKSIWSPNSADVREIYNLTQYRTIATAKMDVALIATTTTPDGNFIMITGAGVPGYDGPDSGAVVAGYKFVKNSANEWQLKSHNIIGEFGAHGYYGGDVYPILLNESTPAFEIISYSGGQGISGKNIYIIAYINNSFKMILGGNYPSGIDISHDNGGTGAGTIEGTDPYYSYDSIVSTSSDNTSPLYDIIITTKGTDIDYSIHKIVPVNSTRIFKFIDGKYSEVK